ncbi:7246_t:CDS:2 [Entrophospora sp. SA101]|nr:7246_t:CDS:2 [Entrophospora sp. SA101]
MGYKIEELKSKLQMIGSPIVFSHNDCQCGNILSLTDGSGQLAIIDLEYSGWNNRGFDIGNHLCEWAFDYNSTESHMEHKDCLSRDELLKQLKIEADGYSLTSHVMWALWAINNSTGHVDDLEEQPLLQQLLKLTSNLQGGNDGNDAANGLSRKNILEHHLIFFNADIRGLTDKITQSQHNQQYLNISLDWNEPVDTALLHSIAWNVERELLPLSAISAHTNYSIA